MENSRSVHDPGSAVAGPSCFEGFFIPTVFTRRARSVLTALRRQISSASFNSVPDPDEGLPLSQASQDRMDWAEADPTNPDVSPFAEMCVPSTLSDEAAQVGPGEDKVAAVVATPTDAARVGPGEDKVAAVAAIPTAASSQRRPLSNKSFKRFAERPDVGNIGVFLCNWGRTAKSRTVQASLDAMIKRSPCQIIIMNEVDDRTANMMRAPPEPSTKVESSTEVSDSDDENPAVAVDSEEKAIAKFYKRPEYEWRVARTDGQKSTLIGVKVENSSEQGLSVLYNKVRQDGPYRKNRKTNNAETHMLSRWWTWRLHWISRSVRLRVQCFLSRLCQYGRAVSTVLAPQSRKPRISER